MDKSIFELFKLLTGQSFGSQGQNPFSFGGNNQNGQNNATINNSQSFYPSYPSEAYNSQNGQNSSQNSSQNNFQNFNQNGFQNYSQNYNQNNFQNNNQNGFQPFQQDNSIMSLIMSLLSKNGNPFSEILSQKSPVKSSSQSNKDAPETTDETPNDEILL